MSSSKNPFYDPEEVDDDTFLRHPRAGTSGYILPQQQQHHSNQGHVNPSPLQDQRQVMLQKRREIEERTLESSNRSLGLLYESEKVGQATAEELARQKEQLKATEQRLDDINSTLKQSERHLQGIKSVFGGIRNYFGGRGSSSSTSVAAAGSSPGGQRLTASHSESVMSGTRSSSSSLADGNQRLESMRNSSHPGLQMRGLDEARMDGRSNVDAILDRNLDEMSLGLSRLKGLAQNLNQELDEHNEIIDRLDDKTSNTHWRVEKQNKDMNKILKK